MRVWWIIRKVPDGLRLEGKEWVSEMHKEEVEDSRHPSSVDIFHVHVCPRNTNRISSASNSQTTHARMNRWWQTWDLNEDAVQRVIIWICLKVRCSLKTITIIVKVKVHFSPLIRTDLCVWEEERTRSCVPDDWVCTGCLVGNQQITFNWLSGFYPHLVYRNV